MTNRTRSYTNLHLRPFSYIIGGSHTKVGQYPACDFDHYETFTPDASSFNDKENGSISDTVRHISRKRLGLRKFKRLPEATGPLRPRGVKECHHTSAVVVGISDDTTFTRSYPAGSPCQYSHDFTSKTSPAAFACSWRGQDLPTILAASSAPLLSSYRSTDWFALMSKFNEATDSIMPSSFLSGEALAEGSIYLDAIRLVIRPKQTILRFIKDVKRRSLTKLSLGELLRHYRKNDYLLDGSRLSERLSLVEKTKFLTKEAVSLDLQQKFGVVPAIQDVVSTVCSHSKVEARLEYLRNHRGGYVPIRVRHTERYGVGEPDLSSATQGSIVVREAERFSVSTISAHGRVRQDLNEGAKWRAYAEYFGLNRVIGTAWELIPFTFVVDWFTNAQERISDLTRFRLGDGPFLDICSFCASEKHVSVTKGYIIPGANSGLFYAALTDPMQPVLFGKRTDTSYSRFLSVPDTSGVVDFSTLGLFHGVTGGELLIQKLL